MLAILIVLHAYIGARLLPPFGVAGAVVGVLVLAASAYAIPFGFRARRPRPGAPWLMWTGLVAMGAFSTLLVLTLLRDVALLALLVVAATTNFAPPAATVARDSALAVAALTAFVTLLGYRNARRIARVRHVDVPISALPTALHGFTIVQITDLHVGPTIGRAFVEGVVDAVNALDADVVAITGDLVDGSVRQLSAHVAPLSRLASRHGTLFVTGNHEYYSGVRAWVAELRRLGLTVLENEHVVIERDDAALVIGGVTDFAAHHFDPAHRSDPHAAIDGAPADAALRVLLALGDRRRIGRVRPAALRAHARWPVPAVELVRAFPAAVHRRASSPRQAVDLYEPRHRLLGTAETIRRAVRNHAAAPRPRRCPRRRRALT